MPFGPPGLAEIPEDSHQGKVLMRLKQATGVCGVYLLAAIMVWVPVRLQAEMLDTRQALQSLSKNPNDREQLISLVQRREVQARLQEFGVSGTEALNRVNSMTDDEVASVVQQIEQYAGGDPLWRESGERDAGYIFTLIIALAVLGCLAFCWLIFI